MWWETQWYIIGHGEGDGTENFVLLQRQIAETSMFTPIITDLFQQGQTYCSKATPPNGGNSYELSPQTRKSMRSTHIPTYKVHY